MVRFNKVTLFRRLKFFWNFYLNLCVYCVISNYLYLKLSVYLYYNADITYVCVNNMFLFSRRMM